MKVKIKYFLACLVTAALFFSGCDLNVSNPNSPTEEDLKTYDGIKLLSIGLQARLSQTIGDYITVSGAVSGETTPGIGYLDYQSLRKYTDNSKRTRLDKANSYVRLVWVGQNKVIKTANDILNNVNNIGMDESTRRGIISLAELGKVMSFYTLITHWEKIPLNTNVASPTFADRAAVIAECVNLLNDIDAKVAAGAFSNEFNKNILGTGFDIANTAKAYRARFMLMKGDYAAAAAAASAVTAESQFVYAESNGYNPLYEHFTLMKFTQALDVWVEGAEAGDQRVAATVDLTTKKGYFGSDTAYAITKYNAPSKPYKMYTLNEMSLIKAEAYARVGGGDPAAEVNKVRAAAGLQPYSGSNILKEIFWQRYYELYLTAQHWEDLRRFKGDGIDIVNQQRSDMLSHEWLTYPDSEVDKNPNTPAQPTLINYGL